MLAFFYVKINYIWILFFLVFLLSIFKFLNKYRLLTNIVINTIDVTIFSKPTYIFNPPKYIIYFINLKVVISYIINTHLIIIK